MSAAEIIEQIKTLPPKERETVVEFFEKAKAESASETREVRYADDAVFRAAADRVFETHAELFRRLAQ